MARVNELRSALEAKQADLRDFLDYGVTVDGNNIEMKSEDYTDARHIMDDISEIKSLIDAENMVSGDYAAGEPGQSVAMGFSAGGSLGGLQAKSLGELFTDSHEFKSLQASGRLTMDQPFELDEADVTSGWGQKDLFTGSLTGGVNPNGFGQIQRDPYVPRAQRPNRVRDLFPQATTSANLIDYFRVLGLDNGGKGNAAPVAPSAIRANAKTYVFNERGEGHFTPTSEPRALERDEIPGIVHDYAVAARNAVQSAGFDGVELHGANGYLLDQFLKTGANQRGDDYGGSIENRARLTLEVARAVADAVGHDRVGIRLSPVTPANDIVDADPQPLFEYLMRQLAPLGLAYVHVIEGATGGPREVEGRPFDYAAMKAAYRSAGGHGAWMVNNGYDAALAEDAIASGRADLVAFGKSFICMPDLAERIRRGGPWAELDKSTMYGGGAKGYTDYPALAS